MCTRNEEVSWWHPAGATATVRVTANAARKGTLTATVDGHVADSNPADDADSAAIQVR